MHLLALTALTDPDTPGHVLTLLATSNDPQVRSYVLAHPNTPTQVANDLHADTGWPVTFAAAHSAAATDATRERLLTHATDTELTLALDRIGTRPALHPQVLTHTIARHRTAANHTRARAIFDRADVPADDAVAALHTLLDSPRTRHPATLLAARIVYAATGPPTALPELTAHAVAAASAHVAARPERNLDAIVTIADALLRLRGTANPRTTYLATAPVTGEPHLRVAATPDPDLAMALLTEHPDDFELQSAVLSAPALTGTPPWRRAHTPDISPAALPADPDVATLHAARHGAVPVYAITDATTQPVHINADTLHALAVATGQLRTTLLTTAAISHLLAHPALRDDDRNRLRTQLRSAPAPERRAGAWDLLTDPRPLNEALAHYPLGDLQQVLDTDVPLATYLAVHARTTTRPLWSNPDLARTALQLADGFTGSVRDLLRVATTILT